MANYNYYKGILESWARELTVKAKELQVLANDDHLDNKNVSRLDRWYKFEKKVEELERDAAQAKEMARKIQDECDT